MNPNLLIFFRRLLICMIIVAACVVLYYAIRQFTNLDLAKIGGYVMYGFFGITMTFMMALIVGVMLKSVWVEIMRRTDNILLCAPDKQHDGVHIIGKHYHSGGDSGDGYDSYHHYYIRLSDGRMYLSKKITTEKQLGKSIAELSGKVKLNLEADTGKSISVGPNVDGDDIPASNSMNLSEGQLNIKGFDNWLDFGFRLSYTRSGKTSWRRTI
jgi:hypothetical protein